MFHHRIHKCQNVRALIVITFRTYLFKLLYVLNFYPGLICSGKVTVVQALSVLGKGKIRLGDKCSLGVYPSPGFYHGELYIEARSSEAFISIGDGVYINNNAAIISDKSSITIGNGTLIGANFTCYDSNFHPLSSKDRLSSDYTCRPVRIGKNVFIGVNVTVLQGVTIGDNSIIGAGVVVTEDVPENSIVSRVSNRVNPLVNIA